MTDLEKRAFAFIKSHTLYDEYKNEPFLDCSDFELMAKFAQQETALLSKHILDLQKTNGALTDRVNELEKDKDYFSDSLDKEVAVKVEMLKKLNEAKEIIKKLKALYFSPVVTKDDVKKQDEILTEAEQFLNSEVEK